MSILQKRLSGPSQLGTTTATLYTVPSSTTTIVKQILLTNTTGSAKTATIRIVPSGATEGAQHDILSAISMSANETISFNCSVVMTAGDTICGLASAGTSVNCLISGVEET